MGNVFTNDHQNYDNLLTEATVKYTTGSEILVKGNKLKRGAVLGYNSTNDKVTLVNKAATDTSKSVYCILAEDVDATDKDMVVPVYYSGGFNTRNLTFGGSDTYKDHKLSARQVAIFFNNIPRG